MKKNNYDIIIFSKTIIFL